MLAFSGLRSVDLPVAPVVLAVRLSARGFSSPLRDFLLWTNQLLHVFSAKHLSITKDILLVYLVVIMPIWGIRSWEIPYKQIQIQYLAKFSLFSHYDSVTWKDRAICPPCLRSYYTMYITRISALQSKHSGSNDAQYHARAIWCAQPPPATLLPAGPIHAQPYAVKDWWVWLAYAGNPPKFECKAGLYYKADEFHLDSYMALNNLELSFTSGCKILNCEAKVSLWRLKLPESIQYRVT
jgi:hypothetical protein